MNVEEKEKKEEREEESQNALGQGNFMKGNDAIDMGDMIGTGGTIKASSMIGMSGMGMTGMSDVGMIGMNGMSDMSMKCMSGVNGKNGMDGPEHLDDEGNETALHEKEFVREFMQEGMNKKKSLEYGEADCRKAIMSEALTLELMQEKKPSDIPVVALSGTLSRTMRREVQEHGVHLRGFRGYNFVHDLGLRFYYR